MSVDASPIAPNPRDCELEPQAATHALPRSVRSAAVLSWTLPPRLAGDACSGVERSFAETQVRYDAKERRAHAVWLRHLLNFGCCTIQDVCEAMDSDQPFLALHRVEARAGQRLCERLEEIIASHSLGGCAAWHPNVTVDLMRAQDSEEPTLVFELDLPYEFSVDSLHRVPLQLARLVYEGFLLISYTVLPCMLPHELWQDQARFQIEEAGDAFQEIRRAGGRCNLAGAAKYIEAHQLNDYFSTDPKELLGQLDYFTTVLYLRPPWMRECDMKRPIEGARKLLKRLRQYEIERGSHPWADYARHVSRTVLSLYSDEAALRRCAKRVQQHQDARFENGVPLFYSLVLSSRTHIENEHLQSHADGLMNQGEHAIEYYELARLAKQQFREILELRAIGLGLLARAEAVNERLNTGRYARKTE